ncbi:LysR family transcriptional regulator [Caldimonas brevitalea]|uniref:HTH lysR-type domain-containing protein n=1 Tax=Caldimonas brevitalea TaxID=413882 RepID=A0A0G3BMZ5_9BURK|nr:LysR family transcriptional regulator [Caldimonas brevitalea]AKJ30814.1 hypothetical protein AAW51_4123 [Caldimonas brevitalea]
MNFQHLRTFVVIAQERSLTLAADKLCLSQPAVSAQLKSLEEELDLRLFDRTPRGMVLTEEGKVIIEEASKALSAAENVKRTAKSFNGNGVRGEFKLGTISEPSVLRLSQFLTLILERYPELRLALSHSISGFIVDRVLERAINAGYIIGEVPHPDLEFIPVAPITLRVVGPMQLQHDIQKATWKDVATYPWITTPAKCSFRQIASDMFARNGVAPRTVIEADQENTLVDLVHTGVGLTLLREDLAIAAETAGKLVIWGPGVEVSHLNLVYLKSERDSPMLRAVLSVISDLWHGNQAGRRSHAARLAVSPTI